MTLRSLSAAVIAAAAIFGFARSASAQREVDVDWRQHDRSDHFSRERLLFPSWVFELRFGGYYPRIDTEPALQGNTPFADTFGTGPKVLFGIEVDWLALRIPYVGALGPGFSWGFASASGLSKIDIDHNPKTGTCNGLTGNLDGCNSADSTTLSMFPMYADVVLRIDDPMVRFGIPVVPYLKLGIDGTIWSAGTDSGKVYKDPKNHDASIASSGWSWGEHFAIGGAISLNWLDRDAVNRSREASGVKNFYVFGEFADYEFKTLGSSKQLRVGSASWVLGVSVDF